MSKILVSACLAGYNTTYKKSNNLNKLVSKLVKQGNCIIVCPEQLGGLKTPRSPAEVQKCEKVLTKDGVDVTKNYQCGAEEVLKIAKMYDCDIAILKERSPSCGTKRYDGTFSKKIIDKPGITTKLLQENGIKVISSEDEEEIEKLLLHKINN